MNTQLIKRFLVVTLLLSMLSSKALPSESKIEFWNTQRKGANGGGGKDPDKWFAAAAEVGIEFVRLTPINWQSEGRDFLLGNADDFKSIPAQDFRKLKETLDIAHRHNVKVLLTMFSLPGARNRQNNDYKFDYRLWTQQKYQHQALAFWKELASKLKNHPAIVGYNPLNEPHPARRDGFESNEDSKGFAQWLDQHKGGNSDLNRFNRLIVKAIRSEDKDTPIVLDCWFHSSPDGFSHLTPVDDDKTLYAFHFYEPWIFVTYRINKGRFSYPDNMPGDSETTTQWTLDEIHRRLRPVVKWAQRYNIPTSRIIAEELGCDRRVSGAKEYLEDIIGVFNDAKWHWAFYSFRAADWDGLDYELGTEKLGWKYWQQREKGIDHEDLIKRHDNPLWDVFKSQFNRKKTNRILAKDIANPDVRKLVQTLTGSDEWRQRQQAAMSISQMGLEARAAIPSLIERLKDEQWHVRKAAAIALTSMGTEAKPAVHSLITALDDEEWHVRKPAAQALAAIGPASRPAVPSLIIALQDEEWHVRKPAAEALAAIGPASEPAVSTLIIALDDEEWHVRKPAAEALAAIGSASKPAISQLIYTLNDEEWQVRKPAAMALGAIGPDAKKAIPTLKEMLNDHEFHVQKAAADALKKITGKRYSSEF